MPQRETLWLNQALERKAKEIIQLCSRGLPRHLHKNPSQFKEFNPNKRPRREVRHREFYRYWVRDPGWWNSGAFVQFNDIMLRNSTQGGDDDEGRPEGVTIKGDLEAHITIHAHYWYHWAFDWTDFVQCFRGVSRHNGWQHDLGGGMIREHFYEMHQRQRNEGWDGVDRYTGRYRGEFQSVIDAAVQRHHVRVERAIALDSGNLIRWS